MGTERETPETDAAFNGDASAGLHPTVLTWDEAQSFTRRIEHQRNELRKLYALDTQYLRAERDEARESVAALEIALAKNANQAAAAESLYRKISALCDEALGSLRRAHNHAIETEHDLLAAMEVLKAENAALRDALRVRLYDTTCRDCGVSVTDDFPTPKPAATTRRKRRWWGTPRISRER